jgi:2-polyprenyl-3-methyl-5-hydroxy-6-metoxy-1,4-benzoquinol methylase
VNIGDKKCKVNTIHNEKYDFVVCPTMINNDGWDDQVFHQLRNYAKLGGYIIFSTKLNINEEDQYQDEI